jgi:threonine dehydratase
MVDDPIEIDPADIRAAASRLAPWIHQTPILTSRAVDERAGATVLFKCENFQRAGAFKFRGAMNAVLQLSDAERSAGVVTHSSGNHGQALALAGQLTGVPVCVVMPRTAPAIKVAATRSYGARIVLCEPTMAARQAGAKELIARHGYTLIHPFDDWRIIAGQGTLGLEFHAQSRPLDMVICPVGGGGLISGTALAVHGEAPACRVIGVEPETADDARRSLAAGAVMPGTDPATIADGLRGSLCRRTFAVIRRHVETIVTVSEMEIVEAMRFVWERLKIVIEPSSAVAVAAALSGKLPLAGLRVGIVVSGGNVELDALFEALKDTTASASAPEGLPQALARSATATS